MSIKFFVRVKAGAKQNSVEKIDANHFKVCVKAPPVGGKANEAVLHILGDFFDVPLSRLRIKSGFTAKEKIIEMVDV